MYFDKFVIADILDIYVKQLILKAHKGDPCYV